MSIIIVAIVIVMVSVVSFIIGAFWVWKIADEALKNQDKQTVRATAYYNVLNQWIKDLHEGREIVDYFKRNNYKSVAIYGYAELGMRLAEELKDVQELEVRYIIDRNVQNVASKLDILQPNDKLPKVDVIVVTPIHVYASIDKMLRESVDYDIVSLEDVVYDL